MSRLRHDVKAYLRAIKMTRTALIVFVEGKENDPPFYARLTARFARDTGKVVEVRRSQELPGAPPVASGGGGGKPWLVKAGQFWIHYLEKYKPKFSCKLIFALDKDIDDLRQTRRPESCFVYTQDHSVENYLIAGCDLCAAGEAALSLLPGELVCVLGFDQSAWMRAAAQLWKKWLVYCVVASSYRHSKATRGYGQPSALNVPRHATCDEVKFRDRLEALRMEAGAPDDEFSAAVARATAIVNDAFSAQLQDRLMKGEWYVDILWSQIEHEVALKGKVVQAGKNGLWSAIRASFTVRDSVYLHYRTAFLQLLEPTV